VTRGSVRMPAGMSLRQLPGLLLCVFTLLLAGEGFR
jgi:hypothetical protein